jgi:hypothetical protein
VILMQKTLLWIFLILLSANAAPSDAPEGAVKSYYSTVLAISEKGCLPNENELQRLAPFMSKRLTALFQNALAYRENFIRDHPPKHTQAGYLLLDKPPLSDGDCFSSNVEGASSFTIGKIKENGGGYRVDLNLARIDSSRAGKTFEWTDAVYVIKENNRFVVDDMEFLGDWPYGNHGLLSKFLRGSLVPDSNK